MMFSTLLITWIILLDRHSFVKTAAISDNDSQNELVTNNMTLIEDTTVVDITTVVPSESKGEIDTPVSSADDVIELNIGGQKITTLRSTLTIVTNSKLARMFSKNNTEQNLPTDKEGAIFFDYNPVYFNYLLDQLRAIKRLPKAPDYQLRFQAPYISSPLNFTHMLVDLGLVGIFHSKTCNIQSEASKVDNVLSPKEGAHINLTVSSLTGWKECYRSTYDIPFNLSLLTKSCNGSQILVACRPVGNKKILTLAGIGEYEDILHPCLPKECKVNGESKEKKKKLKCSSNYQCITQAKRGVGWYNANNQTWGFVRGSLSFVVNPCDASSLDSDYRLCWTSHTVKKQGSGDRCGSAINLQNSTKWERLIYYAV